MNRKSNQMFTHLNNKLIDATEIISKLYADTS